MANPEPEEAAQNPEHWLMFYDGAKYKNGARAGVILISPEGDAMRYAIQIDFTNPTPTNNIAEYEGLLTGLRIAISLGIKRLLAMRQYSANSMGSLCLSIRLVLSL